PGLPADADHRRPQRSARHLLGAGQVERAAPRDAHRPQSPAAEDQHGRRPWRPVRPLDAAARGGGGLYVRADPDGRGGGARTRGGAMRALLAAGLLLLAGNAAPAQRPEPPALSVSVLRDGTAWTVD